MAVHCLHSAVLQCLFERWASLVHRSLQDIFRIGTLLLRGASSPRLCLTVWLGFCCTVSNPEGTLRGIYTYVCAISGVLPRCARRLPPIASIKQQIKQPGRMTDDVIFYASQTACEVILYQILYPFLGFSKAAE